jgi:hypothetical protein
MTLFFVMGIEETKKKENQTPNGQQQLVITIGVTN